MNFKPQFPFFTARPEQVYLDSAASTQRLGAVLKASESYYVNYNASVHRSAYEIANEATQAYECSRTALQKLINASSPSEIVFTSGATESLNLIAQGLHANMLSGRKILIMTSEHHANILPWQMLARQLGLEIETLPLGSEGQFDKREFQALCSKLTQDVALLAIAHVSNALGNIYPLESILKIARQHNILSVIDGTQALAHVPVDVQKLDCDFYVASAHKMYGPTGIGMLFGKYDNLLALLPSKLGGEMLSDASFDSFECAPPPLKFEVGTPNISGVIGFATAAHFVHQHLAEIQVHENTLKAFLLSSLLDISDIKVWGNHAQPETRDNSIATVSISFHQLNVNDVAQYLFQSNIAVRIGHHCAMPLMKVLGIGGTLRISLGCYTSKEEISFFMKHLQAAISALKQDMSSSVSKDSEIIESREGIDSTSLALPIASKIAASKGWDNQYRQLLLASKKLNTLVVEERTEATLLKGCESDVWVANISGELHGYSESKVIRGILSLLLEKANSLGQEASSFDYFTYLEALHLTQYFSQGRRDGVGHVIERIKRLLKTA